MRSSLVWFIASLFFACVALGAWGSGGVAVAVLATLGAVAAVVLAARSTPIRREVAELPLPEPELPNPPVDA